MSVTYRQLIRQARRGDQQAVTEIIELFQGLIKKRAVQYERFFRDFEESKSVATLGVIEGIYSYDLNDNRSVQLHMLDYVMRSFNKEQRRVAKQDRHVIKDFYTQDVRSDYPLDLVDYTLPPPDEIFIRKEILYLLHQGFKTLTTQEQQVVELRYYQRKSCQDIGRILSVHRNTVTNWLRSAKQKLLHFMETTAIEQGKQDEWQDIVESKGRVYCLSSERRKS